MYAISLYNTKVAQAFGKNVLVEIIYLKDLHTQLLFLTTFRPTC